MVQYLVILESEKPRFLDYNRNLYKFVLLLSVRKVQRRKQTDPVLADRIQFVRRI